ncbi:response regulator [Aquabacterium sp.]|uniref:response regulator n=1 Tax=Aquabacterium sp. TaxID=1872578 RepID=UPI003D6D3E28
MEHDRPCHLYLVEDDLSLQDMMSDYLRKQGFTVTAMVRAEEMLQRVSESRPDLILMDIGLPGLDGLDACRRLRAAGHDVPLMLVTARNEEIDRVLGLEMGADDYLSKPFSTRELLARVRALLRRAARPAPVVAESGAGADAAVRIGEHTFMAASRSLQRDGEMRILSTVEYAILAELVLNPHAAITRERLLQVSHPRSDDVMPRAVDASIVRLRKALEPEPSRPRYIQTVRGHGYVFVP